MKVAPKRLPVQETAPPPDEHNTHTHSVGKEGAGGETGVGVSQLLGSVDARRLALVVCVGVVCHKKKRR